MDFVDQVLDGVHELQHAQIVAQAVVVGMIPHPCRQRPHPFPLHKKWEAARAQSEAGLFAALAAIADLEIKRKSGGIPVDVGMEAFLLSKL